MFGAGNAWATDVSKGGTLYVRNHSNGGVGGVWTGANGYMRMVVRGGTGNSDTWITPTLVYGNDREDGAVYAFTIPTVTNAWTTIFITRGSKADHTWAEGDGMWNKTEGFGFSTEHNLIYYYKIDSYDNNWTDYDASSTATNWYVYSSSGEWSDAQLMKATANATTASATVAVSTVSTSLEFYIQSKASGVTLKNNGTMNPTSGAWTFNTSDDNAHFMSTVAGNYTFTMDLDSKEVTITDPTNYTRSDITAADIWGTICLPVDGEISNATLYSIYGKYGDDLYLSPEGTELTAGMPYIFKSSAASPYVTLANTAYSATPKSEEVPHPSHGLYGRYVDQKFETWNTSSVYVVLNDEIHLASQKSGVRAFRAFIQMNDVTNLDSAPTGAPGVRFLPMAPDNATDINSIQSSEKAVKYFENGQLRIVREGVTYDVNGRIVR